MTAPFSGALPAPFSIASNSDALAGDAVLAAGLANLRASFDLFEDPNNLFFRVLRNLHQSW